MYNKVDSSKKNIFPQPPLHFADRDLTGTDLEVRDGHLRFREGLKLACYDNSVYEVRSDGSWVKIREGGQL